MGFDKAKKQVGAALTNVILGVASVGGVAAVSVDWTAQQTELAQHSQQGQVFATINTAVGNYMSVLYPELTDRSEGKAIPAGCAELPYRAGTSVALNSSITSGQCAIKTRLQNGTEYTVANAYQPTIQNLKDLGYLDQGVSGTPVLTTQMVVAGPSESGSASTTLLSNGYIVSITPICVGRGLDADVATCRNVNMALTSAVINSQPFVSSDRVQGLTSVLWSAGPNAALSGPADASNVVKQAERINPSGDFRSLQSGWSRANPITREWSYDESSSTVTYQRGIDGLVMMRNGYESAYWENFRRDGSTKPTADWDFDGKSLTNLGRLQAASASITGDLSVGGNQTIDGNLSTKGNLTTEGTGTFRGLLNAVAGLFVQGATELQGTLKVAGVATFLENVTLEKNLRVKGNTQLDGALAGTSATFTGALTANSLTIGSTLIGPNGTLLGSASGWGVSTGAACGTNLALAQSTDGKVQICRDAKWTSLITSENMVLTAPASGESCSPEGAPGRLPDGTLAVCSGGQWRSTSQGTSEEGGGCSVDGSLATRRAGGSSPNYILMACRSGSWTSDVFAKPKLGYAAAGEPCSMSDELALEGRGYPSLLVCKNNKWQTPGTQLLSNMRTGAGCTLDGLLASDSNKTGLLVCKDSKWAKLTTADDTVALGQSCPYEGATGQSVDDESTLYCDEARQWKSVPSLLYLTRADGGRVKLSRGVHYNGEYYYLFALPDHGPTTALNYDDIAGLFGTSARSVTSRGNHSSPSDRDYSWRSTGRCDFYIASLPSLYELHNLLGSFGGRPPSWGFDFSGHTGRVWTSTRRDECSDWGCNSVRWAGGGGNWWDHVSLNMWNGQIHHNWNSDYHAVILKARKNEAANAQCLAGG